MISDNDNHLEIDCDTNVQLNVVSIKLLRDPWAVSTRFAFDPIIGGPTQPSRAFTKLKSQLCLEVFI
jgi:hypothetical protein